MSKITGKISDAIERFVFGATAQEREERIYTLAKKAMRQDDEHFIAEVDRAFGDAIEDVWGKDGEQEGKSHE